MPAAVVALLTTVARAARRWIAQELLSSFEAELRAVQEIALELRVGGVYLAEVVSVKAPLFSKWVVNSDSAVRYQL